MCLINFLCVIVAMLGHCIAGTEHNHGTSVSEHAFATEQV
jgi:hypothetical protein